MSRFARSAPRDVCGDPPTAQQREDQTEQLEGDDPVIRQFKRDGDLATARRQLEHILQENPKVHRRCSISDA